MPVSMIATATATLPELSPDFVLLASPSMRSMPVGSVWPVAQTAWSSDTNATRGSALIAASRCAGIVAA